MPAVNALRAKTIDQVATLAGREAGPIERFDEAVSGLGALEQQLVARHLARRLRASEERVEHLETIAEALRALEDAGAYLGVVLKVLAAADGGKPRVLLSLVGQPTRLVAGVLPDCPIDSLRPGDEVEVVQSGPQHYAVRRRLGPHTQRGAVARIESRLAANLLRVQRGPDTLVLSAVGALAREMATLDERDLAGRLVTFDEALGFAFEAIGEPERTGFLVREVPRVGRDEVVLAPRTARLLDDEILLPTRHADLAARLGIRRATFFLFAGPPGVGKTHAARWLASELGRPVYFTSGGEIADMWFGGSEAKLRARLAAARAEPGGAVFVWDEAESLLVERGRSLVGVEDRLVALMLNETDGFLGRGGDVIFILITNRPEKMDQALRRSGRAVTVTFERPDAARTRALFATHLRDVPCAGTDAATLARDAAVAVFAARDGLGTLVLRDGSRLPLTPPMIVSGALVRAVCERTRRRAFVRQARDGDGAPGDVTREDLLGALADELAALAQTISLENVRQALTLPKGAVEQIVGYEAAPCGLPAQHFIAEGEA